MKGVYTAAQIRTTEAGLLERTPEGALMRRAAFGLATHAARMLAGRLGCSERQARRYVSQAAASGRVPVPEEGTVFTVRLPARLAAAVREHARASGRTVSSVAAQALEEFLSRAHGGHPRR